MGVTIRPDGANPVGLSPVLPTPPPAIVHVAPSPGRAEPASPSIVSPRANPPAPAPTPSSTRGPPFVTSILPPRTADTVPATTQRGPPFAPSILFPRTASAVPPRPSITPHEVRHDLLSTTDAADIQQRLFALGFYTDTVDGYWGPNSRLALRDFKIAQGLSPNDVFDARTEAALLSPAAARATYSRAPLAGSWTATTYPPPPGATLNPLNQNDGARLQQRLAMLGYYYGTGGGVWGEASHQALQDFKFVNGLGHDDVWDAKTETALMRPTALEASNSFVGLWARGTLQCRTALRRSLRRLSGSEHGAWRRQTMSAASTLSPNRGPLGPRRVYALINRRRCRPFSSKCQPTDLLSLATTRTS